MNKTESGTTQPRLMTGLFRDRTSAERAYDTLAARGYGREDVNLLMSDEARRRHFGSDPGSKTELGTKALEGAGAGAAIGGAVGGALAAAAVVASIAIPGVGLVVAGPIAAALAGVGVGGAAGGVIGALIGAGIPEDRARAYETGLNEGGIVMGVTPRSEEDARYLEREWVKHRGESIFW